MLNKLKDILVGVWIEYDAEIAMGSMIVVICTIMYLGRGCVK